MTTRRVPVVVLLVVVLAALALVEVDDAPPGELDVAASFAMPVGDPAPALSSTWYCAASVADADGDADLAVMVANGGDDPRTGTLTWIPAEGEPVAEPVEVGAHDGVRLVVDEAVPGGAVSAVVELDGGGVTVEHAVDRGGLTSVAPCASAASDRWYLANGATSRDASQELVLFNPFPDDAIVDIVFATDQGADVPEAVQGLPVRARSTTRIELTEVVRRRTVTATSVVARRGRLVVDRVQRFDGSEGRTGLSLALAAPGLAEVWTFPDGEYEDGLAERWHIYNPGDADAVVIIEVVPDSGEVPVPVERTVPARSQLVVDAAEAAPVPAGVGHSSTVRVVNGVGVVAERELSAAPPSSRRGWSSTVGSPLAGERWLLAAGEGSGQVSERLVVHNAATEPVRFSVTALAGGRTTTVDGLSGVELGPAARREIDMGEVLAGSPLPLVVEADGPVVVERDLSPATEPGISMIMGIPMP